MVFSSLSFIYFYIPVTVGCYFILPWRGAKNAVLLLASLVFYSWGEPKLVLLMMAVALVAYVGGLLIDKFAISDERHFDQQGNSALSSFVYITTLALITANLLVFKYLNFFADAVSGIFGGESTLPQIDLPIGISFYTFQILSYVIDLYRGNVAVQKNYFRLLLYVSFFPQLIAGPIVRYSTVESEILHRKENTDDIAYGVKRFIIGLAKKVIIANGVAKFAEIIYGGDPLVYGTAMYWLAAFAYTLQIYFDFSGYSDMAIGLGRIFGFHFLENFDHPYISTSITEFWRRWHISLSSWFRDYVYIPLGGNRVSKGRWLLNLMIVWALTGFWHGASWNFLLWGLYYGVILVIEKFWTGKALTKLPKFFSWIITMLFVICGWVIFNLTDFSAMLGAFRQMFGFAGGTATETLITEGGAAAAGALIIEGGAAVSGWFNFVRSDLLEIYAANTDIAYYALFIPLGFIFMFPIGSKLHKIEEHPLGNILSWFWHVVLFAICTIFLLGSSYNPFIYFRF